MTDNTAIVCVRCGLQTERLPKPPIAGKLGQAIFEQICPNCWQEWRTQSVLVVNHYSLQPVDPDDRAQLYEFMKEFLALRVD